jgi:hypothetical protein
MLSREGSGEMMPLRAQQRGVSDAAMHTLNASTPITRSAKGITAEAV